MEGISSTSPCGYTATQYKLYKDVNLENIAIQELKVCVGDVLGEFDSLYYKTSCGMKLVNNESIGEVIEFSKACENVATLFVYHVTPPEIESDNDYDVDDRDDRSYSDEEFEEIRKTSRLEKEKLDEKRKEQAYRDVGSGTESNSSYESGHLDDVSSEESDGDICYANPPNLRKGKSVAELFNVNTLGKDIKWKVGLIFTDKTQLKNAVRRCSMKSGRPCHFILDDLKRIQVGCAKGSPFKLWATYMQNNQTWQVKTLVDEHNCIWNYKNRLVTVKWLVEKYGDRIRKNPNWKLSEMQDEFKRNLKVEVGEWKCCRVRQRALRAVEDKMKEHYANVRRFGGEILRSNPNNTVKISTTRLQEGDPPRFQRIYICYAGLKKAWKESCRPVLGLDGCFLKTVCGGQLLSAVGRDGNNCIFPVAMAAVESENYESWKWFLEFLIGDLELVM